VIENIGYAFPDKGVEWRRLLAKKNLRMFGRQIAEFIQTSYIDEKFFRKWFVPLPDSESHQRIYERGGICILGHLGNWEWHGFLAGHLAGHDIYTLVKRQRNPLTNRYVERMRNRAHMRFIYIDQNAFITIGKLRKGGLVAFTSDQNARGNGGFFPFFGRLASTYLGPASVARNTKVPVYFVWSYRDKMGRLNFGFEEIERPDEIPVEDSERWEKAFTYRWVRLLEKHVLEHPEDYLWAHNRWKTQPENPEEIWREFQ
jgi:KDO2-lipid IV(A) lauroyltransferase